jgi:penicillin-insensitive murein endopeptidase
MRLSETTPGTRVIRLLAALCVAGWPAFAADDPATPTVAAVAPEVDLPALDPPALDPPPFQPSDLADLPVLAEDSGSADIPLETEALLVTAQRDPAALGPLSIGTPDAGLLLNPVPFPEGPFWTVRDPREAWASDETIGYVLTAIEAVEARNPG